MRRLFVLAIFMAGCGESSPPAPTAPKSGPPVSGPVESKKSSPEDLLASAERERVAALYEQAAAAFMQANPQSPADHEGAAIAKWRLSLMRGVADADVAKEIEAAGDRPRVKALKALIRLVDGARAGGGWEPLAPRILKEVFAKAFPESASFKTDWVAIVRRPDGEIQQICEALAAAPDWPIAAAVRAALEGRDIPPPEKEGLLWILTALRLPPSEAMKMLESATSPDNGILMQAQAQLLAAEGRFTEATGRMTIAPIPVLRAAAHVAAGKPAQALETLESGELSPFGRVIKAAALLQTGTPAALKDLASIPEAGALGYVTFERGLRRLASGDREGLADLAKTKGDGPAAAAWHALGLWHTQDSKALAELKQVDLSKLDPDLALAVTESIAYACFAGGQEDEGNAALLEAIKKTPTRDLYFKYSKMLRGNRQWKAVQELAQAVARSMPTDPEPWAARAEASFWLKNYDAAIQTVTFATEQKLDPKKLLRWRALAYEELGKTQEAHDDWNKLADLDPDMGEAFAHRGWMRARMGRWAEAKDDAQKSAGRGDAWAQALMRFTLAAESLHGVPAEGEDSDPASRKEAALEHLRLSVKSGAVEPSDLDKIQEVFKSLAESEEWKKIVESAAEKQKELKDEAKKGGFLGVMLDHSGGSVAVTGTYRKSGARAAGLAAGDVILEVEGRRVSHIQDVSSMLTGREPGQEVKVKIERELRPKLKLVEVRTLTLSSRAVFEE